MDSTIIPRPLSAARQDREMVQVESLMVNQLGIKPADLQRIRDERVVSVVKQMASLVTSQTSFHELMKNLPPEVQGAKLTEVPDIDFKVGEETIGSFAEKQWLVTEKFATEYLQAFNEVVGLYKLNSVKQVNLVLSMQVDTDDGAPLSKEEISSMLGLETLNKAAATLAGENTHWLDASRVFFLNVQRRLFKGTKAEKEMEEIHEKEKQLQDKETQHTSVVNEMVDAQGKLAAAKSKEGGLAKLKEGKGKYTKWLEEELARANKDLKSAEKRLHDYTARCWGPFRHVWVEDVALAERQVNQLRTEKDDLSKRLEQAKSEAVLNTQQMEADVSAERAKLQELLNEQLAPKKRRLQNEINEWYDELKKMRESVRQVLVETGAASVSHLQQIEDSSQCFAENNKAAATNKNILKGPLARQISTIACLLNQMLEAPTALAQQKKLQAVVTLLTQKDDQAAIFFRKAQVMEAIGTNGGSGFRWELAEIEDVKATPLANGPALQGLPASAAAASPMPTGICIPDSDEETL